MRRMDSNSRGSDNTIERINNSKKSAPSTKQKIWMWVWIILSIFIYFQIFRLAQYTLGKVDSEKLWLYNGVSKVVSIFGSNSAGTSVEEHYLKLAALGDIYSNDKVIKSSKTNSGYDFTTGTENVAQKLKGFDVVIGSLNSPIADKTLGYSTSKLYNTPSEVLDTIKKFGISNIATATSHLLDKNEKGVLQTIDALKEANITQVGIGSKERSKPLILKKNEINLGLVSYTNKSNVKVPANKEYLVNVLNDEVLKEDIKYLKDNNADVIVAYLNMPNEGSTMVNADQKNSVNKLFDAGVNIVLGTGSVVVQEPVEDQIEVNKKYNHVYAIYSLGDVFSDLSAEDKVASVIANIEISKKMTKKKDGTVKNTEVDFKVNPPIGLYTVLDKSNTSKIYIIDDEIKAYNEDKSTLTSKQYKAMAEFKLNINKMFNLSN